MNTAASKRPRPSVLIVMDGWGINPRKEGNAIALARTPNIDRLAREWPHTAVKTSGAAVGLPEGQMGNSEVGHQNIGAGKRVLQDYTRVSESIRDGSFFSNPALLKAYDTGKPFTAHTTYPVPLYLVVPSLADARLRTDGILADVSPTILQILDIPQPKDMTGKSLILP
ncbi:MAG TPA: hypothetical protein VEL31_21970 [Ktedonobacteraceae bacterium]|nr:hypothetical protein [Ktedonobacteraceae bacterium]